MRKILISSVLVLSLCGGAQALAATKPAAPKAAAAAPADPKADACAKQWKAEKKHTQTRKAFMAACAKA
jgi:uncharacterized membrane protein